MTNLLIVGACGRMGKAVATLADENGNFKVVAGVDSSASACREFPLFENFETLQTNSVQIDVIVDFSNPSLLHAMLNYAIEQKIPVVLATTGYSTDDLKEIQAASAHIPVFRSANMSVGVNVMVELCKKASIALGNTFDVEIIEKHHNKKVDAPSGTALLLADEINKVNDGKYSYVHDRSAKRAARSQNEIGMHCVRSGSIVGEHEVTFGGEREILSISHSAVSREVFADGALRAALFLRGKATGMYSMTELLMGVIN